MLLENLSLKGRRSKRSMPWAQTVCFGVLEFVFVLSATIHLADAKPPLAGGAGYAMYFDHERSEIMSWIWSQTPQTAMTIEFWVYTYDHHLYRSYIFDYDAYSLTADGLEISENYALLLTFFNSVPRLGYGAAIYNCDNPECQIYSGQHKYSWHHIALSFDFSSNAGAVLVWFVNGVASLGKGSTGLLRDFYSGDFIIDQLRIWSTNLSAEAISEAYINDRVDPTMHQDLITQLSFDKLINVKGKQYVEDDSGNGNDASYGHWPGIKQSLLMIKEGVQPVQKPRMVGSQADLYGKDIVVHVHPGEEVEITLRGKDPTGDSLITSIVLLPTSNSNVGGGRLTSLDDNIELEVGTAVSTTASVSAGLAPRVRYTAPSSMQADDIEWTAHFEYSVTNTQGETTEATVIIHDHSSFGAPEKEYFTSEDTPVSVLLGSIDMNGSPLSALVTSLPSEGHLYQAVFDQDSNFYGNEDFSNLASPFRCVAAASPSRVRLQRRRKWNGTHLSSKMKPATASQVMPARVAQRLPKPSCQPGPFSTDPSAVRKPKLSSNCVQDHRAEDPRQQRSLTIRRNNARGRHAAHDMAAPFTTYRLEERPYKKMLAAPSLARAAACSRTLALLRA
ncbi:hypothetical protein CYMTET_17185 [Cymbomonas tetramitiformis]|uniref:Uncharacterized protein n=1 Tax=Cymbomonas tetramitiformis TaxID=36881 RepID=A0AAE0L7J6_9CHLO|nr:hypothetical protein CYMTET_17185 [Cymbomonas tetramitiformis]